MRLYLMGVASRKSDGLSRSKSWWRSQLKVVHEKNQTHGPSAP